MLRFLPLSSLRKAVVAVLCCLTVQSSCMAANDMPLPQATGEASFSARYTELTKKILLAGVNIERFSLNYRLENGHLSKLQKMVFFGTQEAGAAGGLAFELVGDQQFSQGRNRPLKINKQRLQHGLRTAEVCSIIAAAGCGFELAANAVHSVRSRRHGFDTKSANRYISSQLQQIDTLISQREALVAANPQHPAHDRAVLEGNILRCMRSEFVDEYSHFSADKRSSFAVQNLFYLLNATYNTVGAIGAGAGYSSVNAPRVNGPANILFIVSGAMAATAPLLCSAQLWAQRRLVLRSQQRQLGFNDADLSEISKDLALLDASDKNQGSLMPSLPSTERLALYTQTNHLFVKQLENETTTMERLNKVALQNSVLGPVIGGLLMTQGILGTRGFYQYFPLRPRKQLDLDYKGSVCGTVGTSMAVVGNAAWLLASMSYEHRLKKQKRLPEQLIRDRLGHLDELEKLVTAL